MKYYLSSFKIGNKPSDYFSLLDSEKSIGYIANALDHMIGENDDWLEEHIASDVEMLKELDLDVRVVDLKEYFGKQEELQNMLSHLSGVWLSGGNVFVLRQAMKLSGFDSIITSGSLPDNFVYSGYSAACCVLSPTLEPYREASNPLAMPYAELKETIWDGLGVLDFAYMPHFKSEHSESASIDAEIKYCIENGIPYRGYMDGEVLIL